MSGERERAVAAAREWLERRSAGISFDPDAVDRLADFRLQAEAEAYERAAESVDVALQFGEPEWFNLYVRGRSEVIRVLAAQARAAMVKAHDAQPGEGRHAD